jgi:RNA polymerase sigma-70 factor (ECF subfamily)
VSEIGELEKLYLDARVRLVAQLAAFLGDVGDAEDVVQEAFSRAVRHWDRIRAYDEPEAWVRRVALNLASSRWRRVRCAAAAMTRLGPAPDVPPLAPDHVALLDALRHLPENNRRAIVMHHLLDLPVGEVAAELGVPSGTIKAWLVRGRRLLALRLEVRDEEAAVVDE